MTNSKSLKNLEKEFYSGQIPFALDENTYKRFSERNTIFARVRWDDTYTSFQKSLASDEPKKVDKPGYSRIGYAARAASWTIYDEFPKVFLWNRINELNFKTDTQLTSNLPKSESNNLEENARLVKRIAKVFGAVETGICEVDDKFIYTHDRAGNPIDFSDYKYAIVMLIKMDYDALKTSPNLPASITTGLAYSQIAFSISCMGEFLRNLGYDAIQSGNNVGLSIPLAINAGLGQLGRNGLLINPKHGQGVRICQVFTNFPMKPDKSIDFGVTEFCMVCKKCSKNCPSKSISDGAPTWKSPHNIISNNDGSFKWYVNVEKCYNFWIPNTGDCSNCITVCPFTKPQGFVHDMARFFIKNIRFMNKFWLLIDDIMGKLPPWRYGKKQKAEKFWKSKKYLNK